MSFESERWTLEDPRLHLRPCSNPLLDVVTTAGASPTGPRLAGRHGTGMLSIGATTAWFDLLALHRDVIEAEAAHHGQKGDRSNRRLVGLCHVADTEEQVSGGVEHGIRQWFHDFQ